MDMIKKNKKNIIIISIFVIVGLLIANYLNFFSGRTYEVGYMDLEENGFIISDYDTFVSVTANEKLKNKYDKDFFVKKSLAVFYVETSTSTNLVRYRFSVVNGDTINIHYRLKSITSDCAMNGYFIVVEVSKDVKKVEGIN